jgi:DNA polymerase elongation subunit (family B)
MDFYTHVSLHGTSLYVIGYENGRRVRKVVPCKPYLFISSNDTNNLYRSINNESLQRIDFKNTWEAQKWIDQYKDLAGFKYFGMERWIYPYIHDQWPGHIEFDAKLIKVGCIDIETDSEDGYPNIELADKRITSIAYRLGNKTIVFGYGEFTSKEVIYIKCRNEKDLLTKFLTMWNTEEWIPDVLTGWNIENFDIPYIVKRVSQILGALEVEKLSPLRKIKTSKRYYRGKEFIYYHWIGINILDYLPLYEKFSQYEQSSYSLNNICHVELNEKKIDYSEYESLADLYKKNHQKFIEYNIRDVDLVFRLEAHLRFIELVYAIAYDAHVNLPDAFTSVLLWDVIIYNYLASKNIIVPQPSKKEKRDFEGAYVKEPLMGIQKSLVSVDVASEYPHVIIQYNISPETMVRKLDNISVDYCLEHDQFDDDGCTITPNGCQFTRDFQGFLPALMEEKFAIRKSYQKQMKLETDQDQKVKFDKAQYAVKIMINSAYGAFANPGFRFYDPDIAECITACGRMVIRNMERKVNHFINIASGTTDQDYIVASDTDSLYLNFDKVVQKYCREETNPIDFLDKICKEKLLPYIERESEKLAKKTNAYKQAIRMNRENIADKALWTAKKRYMMNVWDKEGERYAEPKLKVMGIEMVKSSTPAICRNAMEKAIQIILNKDERQFQSYISEFKKQFFAAPFEEIAFPRGVSDVDKFVDSVTAYKKGSPAHVKGCIIHNRLLKERKMKRWEPIYNGDKIKFAYLKIPNPAKDTVIAATNFLPFKDLNEYLDYNMQWEKAFIEPLNMIIKMIGWNTKKQATLKGLIRRKSING